jgi:SAM-dependent methyltransferase
VITGTDNLFALPECAALLREEAARLPAFVARQPVGHALWLGACAANRHIAFDAGHLHPVRVHAQSAGLRGDVVCAAAALPWEDEAFRLIFAQHVGDVLADSGALLDELVRVLAPGGMLIWCGLNPWSPWSAWMHWRARRGLPIPRATQADLAQRRLEKRQLTCAAPDYIGGCWPRANEEVTNRHSALLARLRGGWMICASKPRVTLTPLHLRPKRERMVIRPQLTPARRACA